jgi:hypothetical protein
VLDVVLAPGELLAATPDPSVDDATVAVEGVVVRGPTTEDLLMALSSARPSATLRQRCVTWPAGVDPLDLPPEVHARVDAAAEELTGASALRVRLGCPECGRDVTAEVDPVALLADRVSDEVRDLLGDVAELAAAFGWSETEVLQLSEARRRAYLDLARQAGAR